MMQIIGALVLAAFLVAVAIRFEKMFRALTVEKRERKAATMRASIRKRDQIRSLERLLACATGTNGETSQGTDENALRERLEAVIFAAEDELDRLGMIQE